MSKDQKQPKLPDPAPVCVICGEKVTCPPFIASKQRRGPTIYAHTSCFKEEQRALKEDNT